MRRPRRRLEVSTFPFLAVLLCAMGSLILLLLVLDRRAKIAARARAEETARAVLAERDATARAAAEAAARRAEERAAERAAERERRRMALHDELSRQKDDLTAQLNSVEGRRSETARGTAAQTQRWRELLEILGSQRDELEKAERETASKRTAAAEAKEMSESARKEAVRLSAQLRGLELVLDELKESRKRDAQTYSLLPYHGKRGDSRRPLYVECTTSGVVFHPDRKTLSAFATPREIRDEVGARVERQRKAVLAQGGQPEKRAYLLMLVRPDGIGTYYGVLGALKGEEIDFGYEFIDADWVLDFPEGDSAPATQPWMTTQRLAIAPADPSAPTRRVKGLHSGPSGDGTDDFHEGDRTGSGAGTAGGGSSDLPPLPGARGGGGAGGSSLPPPPGGGSSGGNGSAIAWNAVGSGTGGSPGGSGLPPLPGASMGGGAGGSGSGGAIVGVPIPGGSRGAGVPNPDGAMPGSPPPTPGGTAGPPVGRIFNPSGPNSDGLKIRPTDQGPLASGQGATGGGGSGAPVLFPFDRSGTGRPGAGGSTGGSGGNGSGPPGNGQPGSAPGGQPSAGPNGGQAGTSSGGGQPGSAGRGGSGSGSPGNGQPGAAPGSQPATGPNAGQAGTSPGNGQPGTAQGGGSGTGSAGTGEPGGQPSAGGDGGSGGTAADGGGSGGAAGGGGRPSDPAPGAPPGRDLGGSGGVASMGGARGAAGAPSSGQPRDPDEPDGPNIGAGMINAPDKSPSPARPRPIRLIGNRDWIIPIECRADGVVLRNAGQKFTTTSLTGGAENPLLLTLRQTIARRQATVRPGEPPYRPQLRFLIYPDGLKTYYTALSAVDPLGVTVTRQNVEADSPPRPSP